jgi:hypothetical protein
MNKFVPIALAATLSLFAIAPAALHAEPIANTAGGGAVNPLAGKVVYSASGSRIAAIYRVTEQGRVQVILDGKLITVPGASLSDVDGKITTSLTKAELLRTAR